MLTFRLKSVDLGSKGPFFTLSIYLYFLLSSFSGPCLGGELILFFKSSGGSVLRTSTFSEASFSEPLWLGVFSVWNSLTLDFGPVLGLLVRHGVYF